MKIPKQLIPLTGLLSCAAAITAHQTVAAPKAGLADDAAADTALVEDTNAPGTAVTPPTDSTSDTEPAIKGIRRDAIVVFGRDVVLKADDSAEAVVVIGGSAKILGKVRDAVVAIGGGGCGGGAGE